MRCSGPEAVLFHTCQNAYRIILTVPGNHSFTSKKRGCSRVAQHAQQPNKIKPFTSFKVFHHSTEKSQRQRVDSLPLWRHYGKLRCLRPGVAVPMSGDSKNKAPLISGYQESHISNIDNSKNSHVSIYVDSIR